MRSIATCADFDKRRDDLLEAGRNMSRRTGVFRRTKIPANGQKRRGIPVRAEFGYVSDYKKDRSIIDATVRDHSLHPIVRSAKVFQDLLTFHIYVDGNGRTARLVMDLILMASGYPPPWFEDTPCPANFEKYFIGHTCVDFDDDPTLLSDVVFEIWLGLQTTQRILTEEGCDIDLGESPLTDPSSIDALTFIPWRHHFKERPPVSRRRERIFENEKVKT